MFCATEEKRSFKVFLVSFVKFSDTRSGFWFLFLATIENKIGDIIIAITLSLKLNCSKCCTKSKKQNV